MGDDYIKDSPPGDLLVNVLVRPHPQFQREHDSLLYEHTISAWDAILGTTISIKTLDNKTLDIKVPAGSQPDTMLSCRGEGLPNMRTRQRGNLLIRIKVAIPKNLTDTQLQLLTQLQNEQ